MDFNKLWQNFVDTVLNHYFDLKGRVGRPQFWYFVLVEVAAAIIVGIIGNIILAGLIGPLFALAMTLPNLGMAVRRMQDTGRNGMLAWVCFGATAVLNVISVLTWIGGVAGALGFLVIFFTIGWIIGLVALISGIAVIYFCAQPGQTEANTYGPVPPVFDPQAAPSKT
ncbi:MAG TPA: DUF805 domain-containing protein [Rhizomicrobium sp.]|nr:DUF805 domain-containing protein [Rhizomicrobium sp.]